MLPKSDYRWIHQVTEHEVAEFGVPAYLVAQSYPSGVPVMPAIVLGKQLQEQFWHASATRSQLLPFTKQIRLEAVHELPELAEAARERIRELTLPSRLTKALEAVWNELEGLLLRAGKSSSLPLIVSVGEHVAEGKVDGSEGLASLYRAVQAAAFNERTLLKRVAERDALVPDALPLTIMHAPGGQLSGIVQQFDPRTGDGTVLYIQARHGIGGGNEAIDVVDEYRLDRRQYSLLARDLAQHWWARDAAGNHHSPKHLGAATAVLSDEQAAKLARLGHAVQERFSDPVRVEWRLVNRQFWITGISFIPERRELPMTDGLTPLARGSVLHLGFCHGPVRIVRTPVEAGRVSADSVVVVAQLTEKLLKALLGKCAGIVAESANVQAYAASLRAARVPVVAGVARATAALLPGQVVTLDAIHGAVYAGLQPQAFHTSPAGNHPAQPVTQVGIVVSDAEGVASVAEGSQTSLVVRGELVLAQLGGHPEELVANRAKAERYAAGVTELVAELYHQRPQQLLYQLHDLHSSQLLGLRGSGGDRYEPNPTIGHRGLHRLLELPEFLAIDLDIVARLLERMISVGIVLPMVRSVAELDQVLAQVRSLELAAHQPIEVWVRCETPALLLDIAEVAGREIAGVLFDVPALTELLLGFDRENRSVGHQVDQSDAVVVAALTHAIAATVEAGAAAGIIAEGVWLRPELVQAAVAAGVQRAIVTPSQAGELAGLLCSIEQQLVMDAA